MTRPIRLRSPEDDSEAARTSMLRSSPGARAAPIECPARGTVAAATIRVGPGVGGTTAAEPGCFGGPGTRIVGTAARLPGIPGPGERLPEIPGAGERLPEIPGAGERLPGIPGIAGIPGIPGPGGILAAGDA